MIKVVEVNNICKRYGKCNVLSDVSFQIQKGSICGFVGKNGAGKTTMLRILTGLQKADSGEYNTFIDNLGAIVETPAFYPEMTAEENMRQLFRIKGRCSFDGIEELLNTVGLEHVKEKKVKDFSLGMKQKLGLAMALEGEPEFIILDEPMNGLDPQGIILLRKLILNLNREKGITFLISSHMLEELTKVATHYIFIENGCIIRQMTAETLQKRQITYDVMQPYKLNIHSKITITDLVIALKEQGCEVLRCYEQDENLEEFFVSMLEERV